MYYEPGWDLITSGAGARCLWGAAALYLVEPAQSAGAPVVYQPLALSASLLNGGMVLWAYFPAGGSLELLAPPAGYPNALSITNADPGAWLPVANNSPYGPARVPRGARALVIYSPSGGYHQATSVPAGYAAWVWPGAGDVIVCTSPAPNVAPNFGGAASVCR